MLPGGTGPLGPKVRSPVTKWALVGAAQGLSDHLPGQWGRRAREIGKFALNHDGYRSAGLRSLRFGALRRSAPVLAAPFGAGWLLVGTRDREIGRTIYLSGGYERSHMAVAVEWLAASGHDPSGTCFVDVGANIGTSTVDALMRFGFSRAVCFEPDATNVRLLRMNLVLNDLDERATVHAVAVSDRDGEGSLRLSSTNWGDHRFTAVPGGPGPDQLQAEPADVLVPCRTLDHFVATGALDPASVGLLWIDAQGHEPQVLGGAARLLAAGVPAVVEYCPWLLRDSITALDEVIQRTYRTVVVLSEAGRGADPRITPADLGGLARRYQRRGYADLLLLP